MSSVEYFSHKLIKTVSCGTLGALILAQNSHIQLSHNLCYEICNSCTYYIDNFTNYYNLFSMQCFIQHILYILLYFSFFLLHFDKLYFIKWQLLHLVIHYAKHISYNGKNSCQTRISNLISNYVILTFYHENQHFISSRLSISTYKSGDRLTMSNSSLMCACFDVLLTH